MKKQLTILLLFFNCLFAWSQGRFVKTTTPCSKELLLKTPGKWMPVRQDFNATVSKQQQELLKRLTVIQKLVYNIYPSPMAFDADQYFFAGDNNFANQLKIESSAYGPRYSYVNGTSSIYFGYRVKFCAYHCGRETNEIMIGHGGEDGTDVKVQINSLDPFILPITDNMHKEDMRIDGRPIKMMPVLRKEKWKGHDVYSPQSGSSEVLILLHREGMLPYIPVTRKTYLDRSIACLQRFFDNNIKAYNEVAALMDKKQRDEKIKQEQKQRDDVIKYYRDELEATTKAGLLDSPAIIPTSPAYPDPNVPIFTTSAAGGRMLVTENPAYFKKDIPKYIPQLIIYRMWNAKDGPDPSLNPYKLYDENFPIEKLQTMIDK